MNAREVFQSVLLSESPLRVWSANVSEVDLCVGSKNAREIHWWEASVTLVDVPMGRAPIFLIGTGKEEHEATANALLALITGQGVSLRALFAAVPLCLLPTCCEAAPSLITWHPTEGWTIAHLAEETDMLRVHPVTFCPFCGTDLTWHAGAALPDIRPLT